MAGGHGVATIAVDYTLATSGHPTWTTAPQDLLTALRWVQEHADAYGIDPSGILLGGMSAGGTLAMSTAYRLQNGMIRAAEGPTPEAPRATARSPRPTTSERDCNGCCWSSATAITAPAPRLRRVRLRRRLRQPHLAEQSADPSRLPRPGAAVPERPGN
ncbi:alpha/beta hydrolase fold domain-containing protein [Streptomyces sp. CB02009]|uniref:alpha/beta hydrolase fold domain-containing protein n=1 Tax=Streptomyces sp. CB02009 TaxID=1703938 RepID=UPI0009A0E3A5